MGNFFAGIWGFMQSDVFVGILGLLTIAAIVLVLFKSKMQPAIAFIVFPTILAGILVLLGRYTFDDVATMIKSGFSSTGPTAALFVYTGAAYRQSGKEFKASPLIFLLGAAALMWEVNGNLRLSVASNRFDLTFVTAFGAVAISGAFLCLCQWLDGVKTGPVAWLNALLRFIGNNSLAVLCFHTLEFTFMPWAEIQAGLSALPDPLEGPGVFILKIAFSTVLTFLVMKTPLRKIFGR